MSIKRFVAGTTSEALRKVRDTLGSEAVILSNRPIEEGVEILALAHADMAALIRPEPEGPGHAAKAVGEEMDEKPATFSSRSATGNRSSLADHFSDHFSSGETPAHGMTKTMPVKLQISAPQADRQPVSGARRTGGERVDRTPNTREIFRALKEPRAGKTAGDPEIPSGLQTTGKDQGITRTAKTPRASRASKATSRLSGAFSAAAMVEPASAASSGPSGALGATAAPSDPDTAIVRADTGKGGPDRAAAGGEKRSRSRSEPAPRIPAQTSGKYAARLAELREKRAPSRKAARGHEVGSRLQAGILRRIADEAAASVLHEISSMKGTLEQQLTALSWSMQQRLDPVHGELVRQLLGAGFGGSLVHDLIAQLPAGIGGKEALSQAKSLLSENLQAMSNENEILEKGGIYALVGPTGVGKTTTTAKLAARCVLRHGADKVALLTTDGYRIGGHEQLRIYGKILGITVHAVRDKRDLALALAELRGRHIVLIDTVGMGQRDQMVAEQTAMLAGCGADIKRLVLLNAASNRHTLDEVVHAYCGNGLAGAIITKLDEAVVTGSALDAAIRHRLPLYYVTRGQRVPEDMELANPVSLVSGALDVLPDLSGFAAFEDEFAFSPVAREDHGIRHGMSEARLG